MSPGNRRRSALTIAGRAAVLLVPLAALQARFAAPLLTPSVVATTAIALHDAARYRADVRIIWLCYAVSLLIVVPVSLIGTALRAPFAVTAGVGALLIVITRRARLHPPVAGLPLSVTATTTAHAVVDLLVIAATTACVLSVLWVLAGRLRTPTATPLPAPRSQARSRWYWRTPG